SRSAQVTERWRVRIDAPERLRDGIGAPHGLEGARDGAAQIVDGRLRLPHGVAPGTVFELRSERHLSRGPFSGSLTTAPGLPTERAEVRIRATGGAPLAVWSDEGATEARSVGGAR